MLTNPPIVATRLFDANREVVFAAFTDADTLAKWWGPNGFSSTFHDFNIEPGGILNLVMHGPDGNDYPITYECLEVIYPELIKLRNPQPTHEFELTVSFDEEANGTLVTWSQQFDSEDEANKLREFLTVANEQNLDKLAAQLA